MFELPQTIFTNRERRLAVFHFQLSIFHTLGHDMFLILQTIYTNRAQRHAAGDSPLFKSFHTLLECFDNIPCLIIGEG